MDALKLRAVSSSEPAVAALIQTHFDLMRASSPEESCHVMQADALSGLFMLGAEASGALLSIGALAQIAPQHGEIKSMHTTAAARGKGAARLILRSLLDEAKRLKLTTVSLETGSADLFAPARALYASEGFNDCPPFGSYTLDPNSVFMTKAI
ncbi:MAG: GNAT family N-acetyltransferase [Aliishimia sp.]